MNRDYSLVGTALAGASLGFLAGVLSAPRSGRHTRQRLARRLEDERRSLTRLGRRAASDAADAMGARLDDARRSVKDAADDLNERLEEARHAAARAVRR